MANSALKACQDLCKQAAIEQDPGRLLTLFLTIDRLIHLASTLPRLPAGELKNDLAASVCPHCSAIIEFEEPRTIVDLLQCAWCEGLFDVGKVIPGSEYDIA